MSVYIAQIIASSDKVGVGTSSATYLTARATTNATTTPTSTTAVIGQQNVAGTYTCSQYFLTFNTSTIPVGQAVRLVLVIGSAPATLGDTLEVRVVSSSANKIAGASLSAQTPLLATWTLTGVPGTTVIPLDTALLPRSSSVILMINSQKEQLGTAATGVEGPTFSSVAASAALRPRLFMPGPWSIVGVGTNVVATATPLTLTEPAGVADGDLLVACIASRTSATAAVTNTGWTQVNFQATNNTLTTGSAIASGTMLYRIKSGTTDLTFDLPAGISVAMGQIVAYRGHSATTPLDVSTAATAAAGTAVSVTGLTTTQDDDLIIAMAAGGQEAAWSAFTNVTTPLTASGATDTTTAPSTTAWIERADNVTTSGADTSLGIFDAVRTSTGATGNLTATASVSAGHVVIAGAFKILRPPSIAEAWNANDKSAVIILSDSDKTATHSTGIAGARSTTTHLNGTAGKYYAEMLMGSVPLNRAGIHNKTLSLTFSTGHFYVFDDGFVYVNGSPVGINLGARSSGDVLCIAWDAGAERVWFRHNSGNWNNNASANPATGANGVDVSFAAAAEHALYSLFTANGASGTIRTELAEYTQAIPLGFTSWMGETPSVSEFTGTGTATLAASAAASGVEGQAGTAAATVNASASASGTHALPVTGTAAATLAASSSASGVEGVAGTASATIALSGAASGAQAASGTAAATLALSAAAAGAFYGEVTGTAAVTLALSAAAAGEVEEPGAATGLVGVWTGGAWVQKPAKVWTGSAWMQKPVKTWNGSAWV